MENDQWAYMEERCIVVDDHDNQIGEGSKKDCHLRNKTDGSTIQHRAFSVFLFDSQNRLLLQRRSSEKITFPLYWANTCCSHPLNTLAEKEVENDIGVKRAAIRKLNHELGISESTWSTDDFVNVLNAHYSAPSDDTWGENEIDHVLVARKDVQLNLNPSEVCEVQYMTYDEIRHFIDSANDQDVKISPWFKKIFLYYGEELFHHLDTIHTICKEGIVSL